jgi:hypothetical protein
MLFIIQSQSKVGSNFGDARSKTPRILPRVHNNQGCQLLRALYERILPPVTLVDFFSTRASVEYSPVGCTNLLGTSSVICRKFQLERSLRILHALRRGDHGERRRFVCPLNHHSLAITNFRQSIG